MGDIARKYRSFSTNQRVAFHVYNTKWKHVIVRDNQSGANKWRAPVFNADGTGYIDVTPNGSTVWYEIVFTESSFRPAVDYDGLQRTNQPGYAGTDVSVDPGDPPPPPNTPQELFLLASMVDRPAAGVTHRAAKSTAKSRTIALEVGPTNGARARKVSAKGAEPVAQLESAGTAEGKVKVTAKAKTKAKVGGGPTSRRGRYAPLGPTTTGSKSKSKRSAARRAPAGKR